MKKEMYLISWNETLTLNYRIEATLEELNKFKKDIQSKPFYTKNSLIIKKIN